MCGVIPFILDVRLVDVPARVTQEEVYTGFLHLPSAALVLIFLGVAGQLDTYSYVSLYEKNKTISCDIYVVSELQAASAKSVIPSRFCYIFVTI